MTTLTCPYSDYCILLLHLIANCEAEGCAPDADPLEFKANLWKVAGWAVIFKKAERQNN